MKDSSTLKDISDKVKRMINEQDEYMFLNDICNDLSSIRDKILKSKYHKENLWRFDSLLNNIYISNNLILAIMKEFLDSTKPKGYKE